MTVALLGLKVKVKLQKSRSKVEMHLMGPQSSVEDSFQICKDVTVINMKYICQLLV